MTSLFNIEKNNIRFSIVDKISDSCGREFFVEIKLTKKFLEKYSPRLDNDFLNYYLSNNMITDREKQILMYIAEGKNNFEIAQYLNVSVHTTKVHIQNIFKKLCVTDRTAAVVTAIKLKLISI